MQLHSQLSDATSRGHKPGSTKGGDLASATGNLVPMELNRMHMTLPTMTYVGCGMLSIWEAHYRLGARVLIGAGHLDTLCINHNSRLLEEKQCFGTRHMFSHITKCVWNSGSLL